MSASLPQTVSVQRHGADLHLGPVCKGVMLGDSSAKWMDVALFGKTSTWAKAGVALHGELGLPDGA